MQQAEEFAGFAAARWTTLLRVAKMLGAPEAVASEVVVDALSRLRSRWSTVSSNGDPELEALALVVAAWDDVRATDWWSQHPAQPPPTGTSVLDSLAPAQRAALVVRHVGEVAPDVVDDAWGPSTVTAEIDAQVWVIARSLPVDAPPRTSARIGEVARRRRARRTRSWAARLAPLAVVVALVAVGLSLGPRGEDDTSRPRSRSPQALGKVDVRAGQDAWTTWYADGVLHLGSAALQVPGVVQLVGVAGGAVYVDTAGRVVRVDTAGERALLGRADRTASLVASFDGGLVAWVDTDTDTATGRPMRAITVVDPVDGSGRRTLPLGPDDGARPVGIRGDRVYVADRTRSFAWIFAKIGPQGNPVTSGIGQPGMLSVVGERAVFGSESSARGSTVRVTVLDPEDRYPAPATWIELPGVDAALGPGGGRVLTRGADGRVELTDLATGMDLPTGVADDETALAADIGPDDQLAYVVVRGADRSGSDEVHSMRTGIVTVRTCTLSRSLAAVDCTDLVTVSGNDATPLISR